MKGTTWSNQVDGKVKPVATHFHWAIRNYEENNQKLQDYRLCCDTYDVESFNNALMNA